MTTLGKAEGTGDPEIPTEKSQSTETQMGIHLESLLSLLKIHERLHALARSAKSESATKIESELARPIRWHFAGLAAVGMSIGFFAGWSTTPVIGALLPILFGVIGAGSGFYLSSPGMDAKRIRRIGIGLLAFIAPTIPAAMLGVSIRTGTGIVNMRPHLFDPPVGEVASVDAGDRTAEYMIHLVRLRSMLMDLGTPSGEIDVIVNKAAGILSRKQSKQLETADVVNSMREVVSVIERLPPEGVGHSSHAEWRDFANEVSAWNDMDVVHAVHYEKRLQTMTMTLRCPSDVPEVFAAKCRSAEELLHRLLLKVQVFASSPQSQLLSVIAVEPSPPRVRGRSRAPASD